MPSIGEGSFLEAYVKLSQLYITVGDIELAEQTAIKGKSRLAGKNAKPKHVADIGWVFANIYLKKGEFQKSLRSVYGN